MATSKSMLLQPQSIAVIGASRDSSKIGSVVLQNIIDSGYKGELYPVNPSARKIQGLKVHKSVLDIDKSIDAAIIVIPAKYVNEVLEDCGMRGIKLVVVISAGFGEADDKGFELELELKRTAAKFNISLLGPNCLGFINSGIDLNATFAATQPIHGNIAFISQSGAMGTAFLDWTLENRVGLRYFISIGNKAGVNENDLLELVAKDKEVSTILLYLEDFADGRKFYELASLIARRKPIVVLKPGESEEASKAISLHTGSIAQDEKIIDTALRESGCIRVHTIEELFNITKVIAWQPELKGNRIAIITNAGGVGVQTVDDLKRNGLDLVPFSRALEKRLAANLPDSASTSNPVDILGDALADRYRETLDQVIKDKGVDGVIVLLTPQLVTQAMLTAKYVNQIADKHNKTVVASFVGGQTVSPAEQFLRNEKIPQFDFPNDGARILGLLYQWQQERAQLKQLKRPLFYPARVSSEIDWGSEHGAVYLSKAQELFRHYKIPLLKSFLSPSKKDIIAEANSKGYPVVVKLVHPELFHKTEFKAVRLNIESEYELQKELRDLGEKAEAKGLKGFQYELQPFMQDVLEVILGVNFDTDSFRKIKGEKYVKSRGFGHVLLFGSGGIYTELYKDVALRLVPVDRREAKEMIMETKVGKIVKGLRGKSYDLSGVVDVITKLSKLVSENTNIASIDINPLFVTKNKVFAADVKILIR